MKFLSNKEVYSNNFPNLTTYNEICTCVKKNIFLTESVGSCIAFSKIKEDCR